MDIYALPKDLKLDDSSSIQLYNYTTKSDLSRSKINLTKNTISFLMHGTKEVIGGDNTITIDNNSFVIMKSGNCLMTERISTVNRSYQSILLFFSDEVIVDFLEKNNISLSTSKKSNSFYACKYDAYIQHYVESLVKILDLNQRLQERLLKAKFEEIMLYLIQKEGADLLKDIMQVHADRSIRFKQIVENNRLKKLTLQELSFLCNMSLSTFKREFVKHYNETPIKWFQEKRLEYSAKLLSAHKKRPIEIYEEVGYESLSNFVQAFKKKFGITPKQYQINN